MVKDEDGYYLMVSRGDDLTKYYSSLRRYKRAHDVIKILLVEE